MKKKKKKRKKKKNTYADIDYSYQSSLTLFQQATANTIQEDLLNSVKNSDRFSLLFDKSTDVSVSQKIIRIRLH